jgi:hypothetical protein
VVLHYSDPEIQTGIAFGSECQESSSSGPRPRVGGLGGIKSPSGGLLSSSTSTLASPVGLGQSPISPSEKTPVLFSYSSSDDEQDFYDAEDFVDDEAEEEV